MNDAELAQVVSAAIDAALNEHREEVRALTGELRMFRIRNQALLHVADN